jgi:hypothetical protein
VTTIAFDGKTIAADSRETHGSDDGGSLKMVCAKLFRKRVGEGRKAHDVIIATAGESSPGMLFVDWYGSGREIPKMLQLAIADFVCLVLTPTGLYEADGYCHLVKRDDTQYAIGSGAKEALAAMYCGKSAAEAVRIAARIDPYTGGRIVSMSLDEPKPKRARKKA